MRLALALKVSVVEEDGVVVGANSQRYYEKYRNNKTFLINQITIINSFLSHMRRKEKDQ